MSKSLNFGDCELMSIQQLNFMLEQIKEQSGIHTVQAVFDGSGEVQFVLSPTGYYDGQTCTCSVPVEVLVGDYYFDWLVETAKELRRGEK